MDKLRKTLPLVNMRHVSEVSGVSYAILRNFRYGKKQYLTDSEFKAVVAAIEDIIGGLR